MNADLWQALETLARERPIVIDRPRGKPHPRYPEVIYPLDYGYLEGTTAADGDGIDVWVGTLFGRTLTGILVTYDPLEGDAEIKILLGCSAADVQTIVAFHRAGMPCEFFPRPDSPEGS